MDGYIVGSMISANSITGEQIQANSIKTANLELSAQQKIQNATDEETVKALIKADLDGFESTLSKEFVTVENAATQIQQATEVAVKEATQNIIDNAVSESMGAVDGQLNDKLNQYTGGTLLPAIAEKAEEVLQNAEDYVVTQLESYATKKELSSSISQTREQIELSVSEKYTTKSESATIITEAIDGITVGAINRALGTGENKSFKFNGGANETWLPYKFSNDVSDKEVFVSFKYTLTGTAQNGSQIQFAPSYMKKTNNQTVYQPKYTFFTSNRLQDVNITNTVSFTTKDFQDISPSSTSYIRFVGNGFTGTLSVSEVQIKQGNSKTSWSPAPEDTITDITNAKNDAIGSANNTLIATIANYYTKSETDSAISVAKDEINLGVSNKYETKTNVETMVNSINVGGRNYVRDYMFKKQDIWQRFKTASTLIDNNNNFGCLSTTDGSVWFYQVMPFETFKQGQVVTIQYEIKCEDISQNTGTSSMLVRTQLTGYDNNGTHIKDVCVFGMHEKEVDNLSEWTKVTVTRTIGDVGVSTQIHLRLYARNLIGKVYFRNVKLELGNKATDLSPAPEDIESNANDYTTQQLSNYYTKEETNSQINIAKEAINLGVSSTYETKTNVTNAINSAKSYADTKKTEAINSANSTLSTTIKNYYTKTETNSQINIAKNAITQSVSSTYATKTDVNSSINSVNSSISNLQTRMNAAESKITDTAITNTVKKNFYTKEETNNQITSKGYQTSSQVQQTVDNLQIEFTQSGGYNRVRNGCFRNGTAHWSKWGSATVSTKVDTGHGYGYSVVLTTTGTNQGVYQKITELKSGKKYTLSAYAYGTASSCGIQVECNGSRYSAKLNTTNVWTKLSVTFTASTTSATIQIGRGGWGSNGSHLFTAIQLEEGSLATSYSPHSSEIYDGITTIDKDGIKVASSNINGYTQMSSSGFYVNKNNTDVFKVDSDGLSLRGVGSNSGRYIKIENEDYTVWNNNINCLRFGYKNWNGWDGVPEFLMGHKGFRYTENTNTGEDASYFGMQTWGRGVKNNNTYAYHDIYYRSDKFGDQHHLRFTEDGLTQLRSLKKIELKAGSSNYIVADKDGGLSFPDGVNTFGVNDTIWLKNSNFGIVWGKYSGKEEYNLRPATTSPVDLGHSSYRYRTIYATNGTINTSDITLKENIIPIVTKEESLNRAICSIAETHSTKDSVPSAEDYYEFVKNLPLYTYDYKNEAGYDRSLHNVGFIAQDVADTPVGNEFIFKGEDGVYQYNMQGYVGVLAVALQNSIKENESLKERVNDLEERLNKLEALLSSQ